MIAVFKLNAPIPRCGRCFGPMLRDWRDEPLRCLWCGTVPGPRRAWEPPEPQKVDSGVVGHPEKYRKGGRAHGEPV